MSNYLFITNNNEAVEALTKQYAEDNNLEFYSFYNNSEDMQKVQELFRNADNLCLFIQNLNKANTSDVLLKILEENSKNIHVFATGKDDVKEALKARFTIKYIKGKSYIKYINDFLADKTIPKEVYSDVYFYKELATYFVNNYDKHTIDNLKLLHSIINDFILATTNLNYEYEYERLRGLRYDNMR